jgi:long-chain fatty acid transport protein
MSTVRPMRIVLALLAATAGLAGSAAAQTNDEIFPQFQWNFASPGARANAMGQAFIGVADDATAATTNPAGLVNLTRPQVYLEYKNTDLRVQRLANADSFFTGQPTTFATSVNSPSFLNIAWPVGSMVAVAFTRHEFLNQQESFRLAPRAFPNTLSGSTILVGFPVTGSDNFNGASYAASVAAAPSKLVSLGLTVSFNHLDARSEAERFNDSAGTSFCNPTCTQANISDVKTSNVIANRTSISQTNNAVAFTIGAIVKPAPWVSVGFDYAKGPSFAVNETKASNPGFSGFPNPCCGTNQPLVTSPGFPVTVPINVPDRFGVGVAVRPLPRLLIAADAVRINYSSLARNIALIFDEGSTVGSHLTIDNVTEIHVGGEVNVSAGANPVFVRGGVFTNPNHTLKFTGPLNDATIPFGNERYTALYDTLPRDTEVYGTVGAGVAVGLHLQLDVAYVAKVAPSAVPGRKDLIASAAIRF